MYHVDYTVNSTWCWTLCTVKSEIPSPAASMAVVETKIATPEDTQPSSVWCFLKNALLKNQQRKNVQRGETKLNIRDKQLHVRVEKLIWKLWVLLAVTEEFLRGNMLTPWMVKGWMFQLRPLTPHWAISVLLCFWNNFTLNYRRHKDRLWEEILQLTVANQGRRAGPYDFKTSYKITFCFALIHNYFASLQACLLTTWYQKKLLKHSSWSWHWNVYQP